MLRLQGLRSSHLKSAIDSADSRRYGLAEQASSAHRHISQDKLSPAAAGALLYRASHLYTDIDTRLAGYVRDHYAELDRMSAGCPLSGSDRGMRADDR
jgi:hypothetical protein